MRSSDDTVNALEDRYPELAEPDVQDECVAMLARLGILGSPELHADTIEAWVLDRREGL